MQLPPAGPRDDPRGRGSAVPGYPTRSTTEVSKTSRRFSFVVDGFWCAPSRHTYRTPPDPRHYTAHVPPLLILLFEAFAPGAWPKIGPDDNAYLPSQVQLCSGPCASLCGQPSSERNPHQLGELRAKLSPHPAPPDVLKGQKHWSIRPQEGALIVSPPDPWA